VTTNILQLSPKCVTSLLQNRLARSDAFMAQVLKNSRRAGARYIRIYCASDGHVMAIFDNGAGSGDLSELFAIDTPVAHTDESQPSPPWGAGLLGAVLASTRVEIHCGSNHTEFQTQELLAHKPIQIRLVRTLRGTMVRLWLRPENRHSAHEWREILDRLVQGFPIPVAINDELLYRPHAIGEKLPFEPSPLGALYLPPWSNDSPYYRGPGLPTLYCNGLPVGSCDRTLGYDRPDVAVLHLDPLHFRCSAADSSELADRATCEAAIRILVQDEYRSRMLKQRQALDPHAFVRTYWRVCCRLGAGKLLDELPLAPSMLSRYRMLPKPGAWGSHPLEEWPDDVSDEGPAVLIRPTHSSYRGEVGERPVPLATLYALARRLPVLDEEVPKTHWVQGRVVDLLDTTLGLHCVLENPLDPVEFAGQWINCLVQLCTSLTIQFDPTPECTVGRGLTEQLTSIVVTDTSVYDPERQCLIVPVGDAAPGREAVRQISAYDDGTCSRTYECQRDAERLTALVDTLRADAATPYLSWALAEVADCPMVNGDMEYRVRFSGEERRWLVEPI
jgi:hypothetical protein